MQKSDEQDIINLKVDSVEELIKLFEHIEQANINDHISGYKKLLKRIGETTLKFYSLLYSLKKESESESKRLVYVSSFLISIFNNLLTIRKLFISGMHLQMLSVMRSQFEQLSVLISFLYDSDFFDRFSEIQSAANMRMTITPKKTNTEKIIRKIFKKGPDIWSEVDGIINFMYDDFSKVAHGDLFYILATSGNDNSGTGGISKPIERTTGLIKNLDLYSQLIWEMVKRKIFELDLIEPQNIEFVNRFKFNA